MDLIVQSRMAIDDLVDTVGRATIEAVLRLSAEQVAGPPQQRRTRLSILITAAHSFPLTAGQFQRTE
jgi:hypothetical protein